MDKLLFKNFYTTINFLDRITSKNTELKYLSPKRFGYFNKACEFYYLICKGKAYVIVVTCLKQDWCHTI